MNAMAAFTVLMELKNVYKTKFGKHKIGRDVSVRLAAVKINCGDRQKRSRRLKSIMPNSITVEDGYAVLKITKLDEYFLKKQLLRNIPGYF